MARGRRSAAATSPRRTRASAEAGEILGWKDDPGIPGGTRKPIPRPVPKLDARPLPIKIESPKPSAKPYDLGTDGFRYWAAAEALRRGADFWSGRLPRGVSWFSSVGRQLHVGLDEGEDLNAYYDRRGLRFFHAPVDGTVVFSGESPDVVCHELGHAVLDGLRPQLWDAASTEVASFHESFGDMSAILSALQLRTSRHEILVSTAGKLYRSTRFSRLAEQLGWAIRQFVPDAVERDCLRNAVNSFFYRDPATLPPSAPASELSSEPHSFSRVFTGGFMEALAGMFVVAGELDEPGLLQVTNDAGQLLVEGVRHSPVVPSYYSQVAAHMIEADAEEFGGRYHDALKAAFVRHGILSLDSAIALTIPQPASPRRDIVAAARRGGAELAQVALSGVDFGLGEDLLVQAAAEPKRFAVAGAAPDLGSAEPPAHDKAAASFVEDLFRRGRIEVEPGTARRGAVRNLLTRKTHELKRADGGLVLVRRLFDCGLACERGSG